MVVVCSAALSSILACSLLLAFLLARLPQMMKPTIESLLVLAGPTERAVVSNVNQSRIVNGLNWEGYEMVIMESNQIVGVFCFQERHQRNKRAGAEARE